MEKRKPARIEGLPVSKREKIVAALAYVSFVSFLVVIFGKDGFERFHAKQALVLAGLGFVVGMTPAIPLIGPLVFIIGLIAVILFSVSGFLHALQGEYFEMPIIAKYAKKIKL